MFAIAWDRFHLPELSVQCEVDCGIVVTVEIECTAKVRANPTELADYAPL